MSRSLEDWNKHKQWLVALRKRIREVAAELDDFPVQFPEQSDEAASIVITLEGAEKDLNELIGASTLEWEKKLSHEDIIRKLLDHDSKELA
jgi:hypothetical protein